METSKLTYVFDIDNTVCRTVGSDYEKSEHIQSRISKVNDLYNQGHTIIFQTARGMGRSGNSPAYANEAFYEFTRQQLNNWGVKFHALFFGKPAGDIYVDDKGMSDERFFS